MTATLFTARPRLDLTSPANGTKPRLLVVLVAPASAVHQCDAALDKALLAGAATVTCEVDVTDRMLTQSVGDVLRAIDDASATRPGVPIVIVGHGDAAAVASMAADACGDEISGLVLTHQRSEQDPTRHAA
ncbi:hypothetical protein [Nocardioides sp. WS12]|uniref:hypothetical protein n=1 Tax=Nocardioides sp. WS12 TaxID=2486272 RepID=UPI0015F9511C|nr:hypothetical protein [Nocardioides sp. WS12]